jgi:tetratricopeptide (TPR) repeat protein
MIRARCALAAALLVVGLAATGALEAQEQGRVLLTVLDEAGKPMPDVQIVVTSPDFKYEQKKKTDKKGQVSILFLDATRNYVMTFTKEGYLTLEQPIKPQIGETLRHTFNLLPATKPAEAEEGPAELTGESQAINVFNEGVTALRGGDQATALAKFQQAAELDPNQVAAYAAQFDVYLAQNKHKEALEAADKYLALKPGDARGLRARFDALNGMNDERAGAALDELAKVDPSKDTAIRIFNEGAERTRSGKMDDAVPYLKRAIEVDPTFEPAYAELGNYYMTRKKYQDALAVAEKHLAANPKSLEAMTVRAEAYKALGDKVKAKEAADALTAGSAGSTPDEVFRQGVAQFNSNSFEQARSTFERVLTMDGNHAKAHYMLGLVNANLGDLAKSKQYLAKFLQMAPNDPDAKNAKEMLDTL